MSDELNTYELEIGNIKWFTINECLSRFRYYNYEKIDLIQRVNNILKQFHLVFN